MNNPYQAPGIAPSEHIGESNTIELAARSSRFLAALVDGLIMGGIVWFVLLVILDYKFQEVAALGFIPKVIMGLSGFVLLFVIQGPFLKKNGQTVGKKLLKIKIVNDDGSRIDFWPVILKRYVLTGLVSNIPIVGGIFSIVDSLCIFRQDKKCIHDHIAGTIVVRA